MSSTLSMSRQRRHDDTGMAAPHLNRGRRAAVLRWVHSADGWSYETQVGVYLGSTPEFLLLEVGGVEQSFSRDQWMVVSR